MTASNLDRQVQFERFTLVDDGFGMVETWADHGEPVFASKKDISDSERWQAGAVAATATSRFQVRSNPFTRDIDPRDRLICEGETFNITGTKEVHPGRRQFIEITAARRADG